MHHALCKDKPIVFVDVETTGGSPQRDRIIEIAVVRIEPDGTERIWSSLVQPHCRISRTITEITGINDGDVVDAPLFSEVALVVEELCHGSLFVAHNARFDYGFIKNEFKRINIKWSLPQLCTVKLFRTLDKDCSKHNLDAVLRRYDISISDNDRHRAQGDAVATKQALVAAYERHGHVVFAEAVKAARGIAGLPEQLAVSEVEQLPDRPGVYYFYNQQDELLYVGKSKRVQTRVKSHFSSYLRTKRQHEMTGQVARIEYEETAGELGALLRESQVVKQDYPLYNRALRKQRQLLIARKSEKDKYASISREIVTEMPQDSENIMRVYKTHRQAEASLAKIAEKYKLCKVLLGIETSRQSCFSYQVRGDCLGACVGKEEVHQYNKRFSAAFQEARVLAWPHRGAVMITEHNLGGDANEVFVVDKWCLVAVGLVNEVGVITWQEVPKHLQNFDYDAYKIIWPYVMNSKPYVTKQVLSRSEMATIRQAMSGEVYYSTEEDQVDVVTEPTIM